MPALQATGIGDLIAAGTKDFGDPDFTEIATDLQEHVAMDTIINDSEAMKKFGSGHALQWNVMVGHNNSATNTGLYDTVRPNQIDTMVQANNPWRYSRYHYSIDSREVSMNRTPRRIIDLLKERRLAGLIAFAELMEGNFWRFPSATDTETPYGVPYWIYKNGTAGFNGGIPSGYSDVAGLSPTTYPRWNNYTAPYTNVSEDDFMPAVRLMLDKITWKPPVAAIPNIVKGTKRRFFTNVTVKQKLEDLTKAQNENVGPDLARYDGGVMIRKTPVEYVPYLDADTTNPFLAIHFGTFKIGYMADQWMKQFVAASLDAQPHVSMTTYYCMYNFLCYNRRQNGVISNGTTYPS